MSLRNNKKINPSSVRVPYDPTGAHVTFGEIKKENAYIWPWAHENKDHYNRNKKYSQNKNKTLIIDFIKEKTAWSIFSYDPPGAHKEARGVN